MKSDTYKKIVNGVVDARNSLNDLTGKDWLPEAKSFFYQKGLGANHPEAQIEKLHPAPYSFQDIGHLVNFFTKHGMSVLDPFGGVGSTAKACEVNGRICTSIELSPVWHNLSIKRLETEVGEGSSQKHHFINGDSCEELLNIPSESMDFMVTSSPYWGILNKQDQKVKKNRVANNLETKYSESEKDLLLITKQDGTIELFGDEDTKMVGHDETYRVCSKLMDIVNNLLLNVNTPSYSSALDLRYLDDTTKVSDTSNPHSDAIEVKQEYSKSKCKEIALAYMREHIRPYLKNPASLQIIDISGSKTGTEYLFAISYTAMNSSGGYTPGTYYCKVDCITGEVTLGGII